MAELHEEPGTSTLAAAALARQPQAAAAPLSAEARQEEAKYQEARKILLRIINWELNDDKHRKIEQILDTTQYLQKICGNVRDNPGEAKYRRIRITNPAFSRHVRDAPGGEEFMHAAGWTVTVHDFEKYFVFEWQPGTLHFRVLEEGCAMLARLSILLEGKLKRGMVDKRAAQEQMRQQVRAAIEEDKAHREVRFQPYTAAVDAQALPPSPRSRALTEQPPV